VLALERRAAAGVLSRQAGEIEKRIIPEVAGGVDSAQDLADPRTEE